MLVKGTIVAFIFFLSTGLVFSQQPRAVFSTGNLPDSFIISLKKHFGNNKEYPPEFEKQILVALSFYPELQNTPIRFRTKHRHSTALTRCTWAGLMETRARRHFVVTISDSTEAALVPVMFKNLPFNAQVGVIGHELAHVVDFSSMTTTQIIWHGIRNVSRKYLDKFEYNTDAICIAHGLGFQLLEWSIFVRKTMNTVNWGGPDNVHRKNNRERYMNPSTIVARIKADPLYNRFWF
jgi:hypothetical protein